MRNAAIIGLLVVALRAPPAAAGNLDSYFIGNTAAMMAGAITAATAPAAPRPESVARLPSFDLVILKHCLYGCRVDEDGATALPRKSDRAVACIASGGDSLIALCSAAPVLGMGRSAAPLVVVRLASDGAETDLGEVGCTSCEYAAWHKERNELLVASFAYSSGPSLRPNGQGQELWSKKLDGGASESWGRWDVVHAIVAAADGFLVSGQPEDGVDGVHLVRGPKERELLLAASTTLLTAVAFDGAQLTVVSPRSGSATLNQLPIEACREDGLLCQPFSRRSIEAIGNALVEELKDRAPNTKDDVIAARDRANAIARSGHGAPLPNQAADVEALVTAMGFARGLSENGRVLCAILVAATAIDARCSIPWVGSTNTASPNSATPRSRPGSRSTKWPSGCKPASLS
jgi:hypothetical protein